MATTKKVPVIGTSNSSSPLSSKDVLSIAWTEGAKATTNFFNIDSGTKTASLSLRGTGDTVKINGYSGDFTASISGSKLTLSSNTQTISITLAASSKLTLQFADTVNATKVVDYTTKAAPKLDGQLLTKSAWHINGQTQHEIDALKAALTDASGTLYPTLADAIKSDNATAIDKAISTATGGVITKLADLATVYTPTFSVAAAGSSALEGSDATFTVSLSVPQAVPTSVTVGLSGVAGAVADSDYNSHFTATGTGVALSGTTLTFAPGATTATIKVPVLTDYDTPEANEGVSASLTAVASSIAKVNATLATDKVIITDVPKTFTTTDSTSDAKTLTAKANVPDTYDIKAGNYNVTIDGFASGDKLDFFAGATLNVVRDTDQTDKTQQITATDSNGVVTTITLKNLTDAQDTGLNNLSSFNTQFAPDTISIGGVSQTTITKDISSSTTGIVNATAGLDVFNIKSGAYGVTIDGFKPGDSLNFFNGATLNVIRDTDNTDKTQQITATDSNGIVTIITLTGLTDAQDQGLFTTTSFTNQFGAGTLTFA